MPIYEYECPACGTPFEKRVSIAEADKTTCPTCGSSHPKRKLSKVALNGVQTQSNATLPASGGT